MPQVLSAVLEPSLVLGASILLGGLGYACFRVGFALLGANRAELDAMRERVPSVAAVAFGEVKAERDGRRDHRVHAGIAVDRHTNTWVPRGQASKDALDVIYRT